VKSYLQHESVPIDGKQIRLKVGIPPDIESSLDRIPTRDEMRLLLRDSDPRVRALISLLATSGLRIGEAALLRVGNLNLDEERVTVMAKKTKSRSMRIDRPSSLYRMPPCTSSCPVYTPSSLALYVLAVNAGFVSANGIQLGDSFSFV
jgi:integrase